MGKRIACVGGMMHNKSMVSQVVMETADPDHPAIRTVDNSENRPPISFENRIGHRRIPRFGSQDLIRVAAYAASVGFKVDELELVDGTLSPLPKGTQRKISERLKKVLAQNGPGEVVRVLLDEYPTFGVIAVQLSSDEQLGITLRRNGVVQSEPGLSADDFLTQAWKSLRFS